MIVDDYNPRDRICFLEQTTRVAYSFLQLDPKFVNVARDATSDPIGDVAQNTDV